jgi:hypothetical protein
MEYKIETGIPIPEPVEGDDFDDPSPVDETPPEENSRWVPYKPNARKCANNRHRPEAGKCELCGDIFPCPSGNCGHADCAYPSLVGLDCPGNGTELPEWMNAEQA